MLISFNPNGVRGGPDNTGAIRGSRPAFVGVAHELGHAEERVQTGRNNFRVWTETEDPKKPVYEAEKHAMHVENLIRAEHNLPLRTHYYYNSQTKERIAPALIPNSRITLHFPSQMTIYNRGMVNTTIRLPWYGYKNFLNYYDCALHAFFFL
jgi:hypothetical protein